MDIKQEKNPENDQKVVIKEVMLINAPKTMQMIEEIKAMENDETRPNKRKRVVLTLDEKRSVILEREKGYSFETVAKNFNIGTTTVKDIVKRREAIFKALARDREKGLKRKVVNPGRKPEVEQKLYSYLIKRTEQGEIIYNKDLIGEASVINKQLYNEDWKPSSGWLKKFKNRYCIDTKHVSDAGNTSCEDEYDEDETILEDEIELEMMEEEEENNEIIEQIEEPKPSQSKNTASISVLNACDVLLDFMNEYDFPLKEIITLRVVKDRISKMPESQMTYEVQQEPQQNKERPKFEIITCGETKL